MNDTENMAMNGLRQTQENPAREIFESLSKSFTPNQIVDIISTLRGIAKNEYILQAEKLSEEAKQMSNLSSQI